MRMPSDKEANAPVFEIDHEFGKMAVSMGQAAWSIPELNQREKSFTCLAADVCLRDLGLPFQMHVQMSLGNDVPLNHVREAILQAAIEAGHTGTLVALKRLKEVCDEIGEPLASDGRVSGAEPSFEYFTESNGTNIDSELSRMWRGLMPTYWHRPGLSIKERIYISLASNVLQGILGVPFVHHVQLARAQGAGDEQLRALFRFLSEYGFSRSWAALDVLANLR